ncbi:hypothetical protein ZIOFF_069477 [Zingiber officinale]|uniref:ADF-H domain-containing protein n=1 Tax=Zingiber officinale TaxID=94328 RepID=A0A8J5CBV6_ZINOF|nr:hypothetical protein ZIOFF_069477 [Zingiber officinale]
MPNYHSTFSQMHLLEWSLLRIAKKYSLELQRKKTDRHDESKSKLSWRRLETLLKVMMILWHLFIAWSYFVSRIRAKMLYATSKDRFRRELDGVHYELQATDLTELDHEILRERAP